MVSEDECVNHSGNTQAEGDRCLADVLVKGDDGLECALPRE
jgi:hypothetical protein